jgi:hypothetical protein
MELNDNEFDAAFREKVFDADPQFEEAAWNKMEQRLERRDRMVFFRKAAALCLLFLVAFGAYMLVNQQSERKINSAVHKSKPKPIKPIPETERLATKASPSIETEGAFRVSRPAIRINQPFAASMNQPDVFMDTARKMRSTLAPLVTYGITTGATALALDQLKPLILANNPDTNAVAYRGSDVPAPSVASVVKKQKMKPAHPLPMSLSLSAGPEFNSSGSLIGGKKGFSAGVSLGIGVAKRLSLQTGLRYSAKSYAADRYEYKFGSERIQSLISEVDASCAVLEIPIQASYTIFEKSNKSIDINAGMSSYFMLKEDYNFRYTAASGYADRLQQFRNRNQHYFGVVDLSATYYIKLKQEKLRLGLEPYVKIPVTGVGEGRVNLKSNGLSIKLRYELGKNEN